MGPTSMRWFLPPSKQARAFAVNEPIAETEEWSDDGVEGIV